jgi:hypothetical protein
MHRSYDMHAPNIIADSDGNVVGVAVKWNPSGIGEIIVQYFDGSADSAYGKDLHFPNGREKAYEYLSSLEP